MIDGQIFGQFQQHNCFHRLSPDQYTNKQTASKQSGIGKTKTRGNHIKINLYKWFFRTRRSAI